ncbi:MAG TPA: hypothetical protein VGN08_04080 [Solirubrobacteraceae bacterium]
MRPNPLSIDTRRRLTVVPALTACLAALAFLLGVPAQAQARVHAHGSTKRAQSSTCRHPSAARRARAHHACVRASHRSKAPAHHSKKHPHSAVRHAKPSTGAKPAGATSSANGEAARCEDGSAPLRVGSEVFECQDGSEPRCEAGSALTISDDGSTLLCAAVMPTAPGGEEGGCAEGSACAPEAPGPDCAEASEASAGGDPSASCEEPGAPACEAGQGATGSGGETPCAVPVEEGDESSVRAAQRPGAPTSQVARAS